jgi:hypothetical protein
MVCVVGFSVEMGVLEGYGGFWRVYGIWWVFFMDFGGILCLFCRVL